MPGKVVTVGVTPTKLLDQRIERKQWIIQVPGDATTKIYVSEDKEVSVSGTRKGREIDIGQTETANRELDPELIKKAQYAVVSTGTVDVWVWEA